MEFLTRTFVGKRLICTPYIPVPTLKNDEHTVFVHVRDEHHTKMKEQPGYIAPIPGEEFLFKWRSGGLKITCKESTPMEDETTTLQETEINHLTERKVMFKVDTRTAAGNRVILHFILEQSTRKELLVPMYLKGEQSGISASTSAAIPLQEALAPAREVYSPRSSDTVSDGELNTLVAQIPHDKYYHLTDRLGIGYNEASTILSMHGGTYQKATRECLSIWKNKTGGRLTELKRILDSVHLGGISIQYYDIPLVDASAGADEVFLTSRARPTEESMEQDFDDLLNTVAQQIRKHYDIDKLGRELGFKPPEIQRYIQMNERHQTFTIIGTLSMLRDWRKRTKRSEECIRLKKALIAINHHRLAEDLLNDDMDKLTETSPGKPDSTSLRPSASKSVNILPEDASAAAGEVSTSQARPTEESMEEDFDSLLKTVAQQIHKDADIDSLEISETSPGKRDSAFPRPSASTSVDISPQDASAAAGEVSTSEARRIEGNSEENANINKVDNNSFSHLDPAVELQNEEVMKVPLASDAQPDALNNEGKGAPHDACIKGDFNAITVVINAGADVDIKSNHHSTPQLLAAENGHHSSVEKLVTHGADPTQMGNDGLNEINPEFDGILKKIARALFKHSDIDELGSKLRFQPADIGRFYNANAQEGGNWMGTLNMLRKWHAGQTESTRKAALRSALIDSGFLNLADEHLGTCSAEGSTVPEQLQKIGDSHMPRGIDSTPAAPGSSEGQTKTHDTTAATDQLRLHDQSSENHGDETSECMGQHSRNSSINNLADDGQETPSGVSSVEPFHEEPDKLDKLLMLLVMMVLGDVCFISFC